MSRSDYLFFNTLGQRYMEKGGEFEKEKLFACAFQSFSAAAECYAKAEEIVLSDMMVDHGTSGDKKIFCQQKASELKGRDDEKARPYHDDTTKVIDTKIEEEARRK